MKIQGPVGSREMPEDRNPIYLRTQYEANTVAPHGFTQRGSLTVPANRLIIVQSLEIYVSRGLAAAPAGEVKALISLFGAATNYWILHASHLNNTVNFAVVIHAEPMLILGQGEEIRMYTIDGSTGGNMNYNITILAVECDK